MWGNVFAEEPRTARDTRGNVKDPETPEHGFGIVRQELQSVGTRRDGGESTEILKRNRK